MTRSWTVVVTSVALTACSMTTGSGAFAGETRSVEGFDAIDVSSSVDVQVAVGPSFGVIVEGDDNIVPLIRTRVQGNTLEIDSEFGKSFSPSQPLTVLVTMPDLQGVGVSGSGNVTAVGVGGRSLDISVSGSGSIDLSGTVTSLAADVSGSGSVAAAALEAAQADVSVSGSGSVAVRANDTLTISVSGSGSVEYFGEASVTSDVSGSGSVSRGG